MINCRARHLGGILFILLVWFYAAVQAGEPDPTPPMLPFKYGGNGMVNGKPVLFLERDNESFLVQVDDIFQQAYRLERVERNYAVLRYLPLDAAQVLPFNAASPAGHKPTVFVDVPDEVTIGQEFPLALLLASGSGAVRATVEVTFDAKAFSISGARVVGPGRAVVEVSGGEGDTERQLRLKPLTQHDGIFELGIEVNAFDQLGESIDSGSPAQRTISVISVIKPRPSLR